MAQHTITLSVEQELALTAKTEAWRLAQIRDTPPDGTPAPALTEDEVLERIVFTSLEKELADIEAQLQRLREAAQALPQAIRDRMTEGLTGPQRAKLGHLFTTDEAPNDRNGRDRDQVPRSDRPVRQDR